MDKGQLKYTDEELVDLGWTQIKDHIPSKRRDRALWIWIPLVASFLLGGFFLINTINTSKREVQDVSKNESRNSSINTIPKTDIKDYYPILEADEKSQFSEQKKMNIIPLQLESTINQSQITIEKQADKPLLNIKKANTSLKKTISSEDNMPETFDRLVTEQIEYIEQPLSSVKNGIINHKKNNDLKQKDGIQMLDVDNNAKDGITSVLSEQEDFMKTETTMAVEEDPENNDEKSIEIKKRKQRNMTITPIATLQTQTNSFINVGPAIGIGTQVNLNEKQALTVNLKASFLSEELSNFTTFDRLSDTQSNLFDAESREPSEYKLLLIELPIAFSQKISENIRLQGGIIPSYANFSDYSSTSNNSETFIVQDKSLDQNAFRQTVSTLAVNSNIYKISDSFVDQFEQYSLGIHLGGEVRIKDSWSVLADSSFGYQSNDQTPFLDFAPTFVQIGTKFYLSKSNQ